MNREELNKLIEQMRNLTHGILITTIIPTIFFGFYIWSKKIDVEYGPSTEECVKLCLHNGVKQFTYQKPAICICNSKE